MAELLKSRGLDHAIVEEACARLVAEGLLDAAHLPKLRAVAEKMGEPLEIVVPTVEGISPAAMARALGNVMGIPVVDLQREPPDPALLDPARLHDYIRYLAVPHRREANGGIVLAMRYPDDEEAIAFFAEALDDADIQPAVTTRVGILQTLQHLSPTAGTTISRLFSARHSGALREQVAARLISEGVLDGSILPRLRDLAIAWQVPLGEVVTSVGRVPAIAWACALADLTGLGFVDLRQDPPDPTLLDPARRLDYIRFGAIPYRREVDGSVVLAMRTPTDAEAVKFFSDLLGGARIRRAVTTRLDVLWSLQRAFDDITASEARDALYNADPLLSARTTFSRGQVIAAYVLFTALFMGLAFKPVATLIFLSGTVTVLYIAMFLFRFVLTWIGADRRADISVSQAEIAALKDDELPVFTVLIPMYHEREVLPILVDSMRRLDYPRAKLDVKLVLEEGDIETIEAAKALHAESFFEIVRVPNSLPKTKPKACNYALRFARGEYTVVFDAEDIPEPDQLRKVVAVFHRSSERVACVQARLNYFNRDDNFLTRMFTLEYSLWFDYLLPGLDALKVPIPLGGTSNHFRTSILLALGAWDPYNVTEDADLGVRLTQAGYRVAVVNSTTFEEANSVYRSWINQRSRWIKGYMQTWLVHMRRPIELWRRLGPVGFVGFQLFIGFPPVTTLINPLMWATFAIGIAIGPEHIAQFYPGVVLDLALFNLLAGNATYMYFFMVAAAKRRWYHLIPWGILAPLYWVMHSVAAYKAVWQLLVKPHYWEKTQHGTSAATHKVLNNLGRGPAP